MSDLEQFPSYLYYAYKDIRNKEYSNAVRLYQDNAFDFYRSKASSNDGNSAVLSARGNLFQIKAIKPTAVQAELTGGGLRGTIGAFSDASRLRLLKLSASLDYNKASSTPIQFLTLTYHNKYPSPIETKKHIKNLFDRLRRRVGWAGASAIWRLEFQRRGAPHFHLMVFNAPYMLVRDYLKDSNGRYIVDDNDSPILSDDCWLSIWRSITGDDSITQIKNEKILHDGWRHVMSYVSKYTAKKSDIDSLPAAPTHICCHCRRYTRLLPDGLGCMSCGSLGAVMPDERFSEDGGALAPAALDYAAYLRGGFSLIPIPPNMGYIGRYWGVFQRANLPLGDPVSVWVGVDWSRSRAAYYHVRRLCRKIYARFGRYHSSSTLFFHNASQLIKLFHYYIETLDKVSPLENLTKTFRLGHV